MARLWPAVLLAGLIACDVTGSGAASQVPFAPPEPLSVVAILDRDGDRVTAELQELEAVVEQEPTPSETLVVTRVSVAPVAEQYVLRAGDNLDAVAGAHGLSLATLEAANPQLGPVAGRSWSRVDPGDRVTIPDRRSEALVDNPIVTRAPAGPPPPGLVRAPQRPGSPTSFQLAQYQHALAAAQATNRARVDAWRAAVRRDLAPWRAQVVGEIRAAASRPSGPADAAGVDLGASIRAAATTLGGLPGRRVMLVLGPGRDGPPGAGMGSGDLAGIHLVVADLTGPAGPVWASAAEAAGAPSVTTLDPALTRLQLAASVRGPEQSG